MFAHVLNFVIFVVMATLSTRTIAKSTVGTRKGHSRSQKQKRVNRGPIGRRFSMDTILSPSFCNFITPCVACAHGQWFVIDREGIEA